jgi:hypothetical protein
VGTNELCSNEDGLNSARRMLILLGSDDGAYQWMPRAFPTPRRTLMLDERLFVVCTGPVVDASNAAGWPQGPSGGGRLMEAEAHPLVVSAEGKPAEARFFRAGIVGVATELANSDNGGVDVRN